MPDMMPMSLEACDQFLNDSFCGSPPGYSIHSVGQNAFPCSNTDIFSQAGAFFTRYSNFNASFLAIFELALTIATGVRDRVYLVPMPELCFNNRFSISLVMPQ